MPGRAGSTVTFLAFDLLHLDGLDTDRSPLSGSPGASRVVGLDGERWSVAPAVPGTGRDAAAVARGLGLRGVVAKRLSLSPGTKSPADRSAE